MSVEKSAPVEEWTECAADWQTWFGQLGAFTQLNDGWNGYSAPAPNAAAIAAAGLFLNLMRQEHFPPTRIAPSAMGGVGITRRQGERKVYVEFYNDGSAHALFSSGLAGMNTRPVPADPSGALAFVAEMRNYLNG
jgi:hypothetical protein